MKCRNCGCTDEDCHCYIVHTGTPCWWVEPDLCSGCAGPDPCRGEADDS